MAMAMAIVTRRRWDRAGIAAIACALACLWLGGCRQTDRIGSRARARGGLADGQAADIQVALGRSFEADRDFDKALAAYREAARTSPRKAEPRLRTAILLDRLGRFAEAAPHYEAALKASPADPEIYTDRGYSLCLQGREAEGEVALRQAIAIRPDLARAHNNLGALLGRTGRADEALAEFRKGGSPEADARLNLAFALGQGRRWSEARTQLELAKRSTPAGRDIGGDSAHLEALIARAEASKLAPAGGDGRIADPAVITAGAEGPSDADADAPPPRGLLARRRARRAAHHAD